MIDYPLTLSTIILGAKMSYTGLNVGYKDITWTDARPQPTEQECVAAWPTIQYEQAYAAVERSRRERYQIETDGLFFDAQRNNGSLDAWASAVDTIKAELPYPSSI